MIKFESEILQKATIEELDYYTIIKIIINSGEYTEEEKKAFIEELKKVLFSHYAHLESLDLSNIDLDEKYLREIFRNAGTADIKVNPESEFYSFLSQTSDLSERCKKRLGLKENSNNQAVYKKIVELKRSSFHSAIIPAKDALKLDEFLFLGLANFYNLEIGDFEDLESFMKLDETIPFGNKKIFVREGISLEGIDIRLVHTVEGVVEGEVSLSKAEALSYSEQTTNDRGGKKELREELYTEELILGAMENKCIPARALPLIGAEKLEGIRKLTLSVETEEDKNVLEEYKKEALQNTAVSLAASTVAQMPLEILEGLNIERVMVGTDENINGKYSAEDYKKIYAELESVVSEINLDSSDYDNFQIIYERLAKRLKFDYKAYPKSKEYDEEHTRQTGHSGIIDPSTGRDVSRIGNLETLINNGESVCLGYAEVLRQALSMIGIEAHVIFGKTEEESETGHAWNRVKLDGKLYNCDLTGDVNSINKFGIYKKARTRRVLRNNPSLSKKIMPLHYLKSDKEFGKKHIPYNKPEGEALEDFDADSYYKKDFRSFLKSIFQSISTRLCRTVETVMWSDIGEWEKGKGIREERTEDDRGL